MADALDVHVEATELAMLGSAPTELAAALAWLDHLIACAVAATETSQPAETTHAYRGLYISSRDIATLLTRTPGASPFGPDAQAALADVPEFDAPTSQLGRLAQTFGLSRFELAILLIALAPELDLRYERLYAYLQDDLTRRWPTVELALSLLCSDAAAKWAGRSCFAADAPLCGHHLLRLVPDAQAQQPLLAHFLKPDEAVVRFLLGQPILDARLHGWCELVMPAAWPDLPLAATPDQSLTELVGTAWATREPLNVYLYGPSGAGQRQLAEALAQQINVPLLVVDLARCADLEQLLPLIFRDARLLDAIVYIDGLEQLRQDDHSRRSQRVEAALGANAGVHLLAGTQPWLPSAHVRGVIAVALTLPDYATRRRCWQANLIWAGLPIDAALIDALAGRFRLTLDQIADAVVTARNTARWQAGGAAPAADLATQLFAAARSQCGHDLGTLARKLTPIYTWDDLVLPAAALSQLRSLCSRVIHRQRVLHEWGFGRRLSLGRGVNALFAGPSGTGKTMAAEVIANELALDLYKIDLASVVSKYIGETEKNLDRIFTAAEHANAILFFDEADALFGKRSEVRDSHDRYANLEISYLLQKMEQYEGIAILATNLRENMDDAFLRRLQFIVEFPFPDQAHREQIWQVLLPADTRRAETIDFAFLARQFRLAGGNIRSIVLSAAFLAAADGGCIDMQHLIKATWDEYQKLGRVLSVDDLGPYAAAVR